MKKSKIKRIVHNAVKIYFSQGLTSTGHKVQSKIYKDLDNLYNSKTNNKR